MMPSVAWSVPPVRSVPARRGRPLEAAVLLSLVVGLVGCLTAESTLKPDGSGTFEMSYRTAPNPSADAEKRRFSSDHVTVDSFRFTDTSAAAITGHFDDVTKLASAEGFRSVTVTRTREGDDERLAIAITNPTPATIKDDGAPGPKITLRLPGKVQEANRGAKVADDRVTWSFSLAEWLKEKSVSLTVRYAAPADAKAGHPDSPTKKNEAAH